MKLITKKIKHCKIFGGYNDKLITFYELHLGSVIYRIMPTKYSFHFGVWTSDDRNQKGYIVQSFNEVTDNINLGFNNIEESYSRSFNEVKSWLLRKVA